MTTTSAEKARDAILESAGAVLPKRDAVDVRIIHLTRSGEGKLINSAHEVGGWPELKSVPPPADADRDGMPDEWESKHRLNPRRADDTDDTDADGYTHVEEFLNGTDPLEK